MNQISAFLVAESENGGIVMASMASFAAFRFLQMSTRRSCTVDAIMACVAVGRHSGLVKRKR